MSLNEYIWILGCTDPEVYRKIAHYLIEKQRFEESRMIDVTCPDGVVRQSLEVPYEMVKETEKMRRGSDRDDIRLMFKKTRNGAVQFWPPGSQGLAPLSAKGKKALRAAEVDSDPPPF